LFKQTPSKTNSTGVLLGKSGWFIDRAYNRDVNPAETADEVFCVSAGAALYRRKMLDDIRLASGFFDRTFFMYYEDVDLGWRGRLAGWSAVYHPEATVHHAYNASSSRRGKYFVRSQCAKNRVRTVLKNGSRVYIAGSIFRMLFELAWCVTKEGVRALEGYGAAIRDGLSQRGSVDMVVRRDRRALEKQWIRIGATAA
jgi:GT2 family glycosyltransferase